MRICILCEIASIEVFVYEYLCLHEIVLRREVLINIDFSKSVDMFEEPTSLTNCLKR